MNTVKSKRTSDAVKHPYFGVIGGLIVAVSIVGALLIIGRLS